MHERCGRRLAGQRLTGAHELKWLPPHRSHAITTLPFRNPAVHRPFGLFAVAFDLLADPCLRWSVGGRWRGGGMARRRRKGIQMAGTALARRATRLLVLVVAMAVLTGPAAAS